MIQKVGGALRTPDMCVPQVWSSVGAICGVILWRDREGYCGMQATGEMFRSTLMAILLLVVCMVGNFFLPPVVLEMWIRDADVGLWFSAGLLLTQLSIPGWVCYVKLGTIPFRLLSGVAFALACILCAWGGFRNSGPVSQADAFAFMAVVFLPPVLFVGLDLMTMLRTGLRIEHGGQAVSHRAIGRHEWSFGLTSLFGWVILVAIAAAVWRNAAGMNAVSYRDVRGFLADSPSYTLARVAFFGALHVGTIFLTLSLKMRWAWAWLVPGFILGLEGTRRILFQASGTLPPYLEWDFAMLSMGFLVGHLVLGTSLRFLGWTLRSG